jgi:RHS repeat-associated protein
LPGSNPVTWKESYTYDSAARPSTIATTIKEGAAVALNSAMSYDSSGRPDTHTYPDGLVVRTLYGPYGQSGGQADGSAGTIWYEITAMDAWGKPTTEQYADGTVGTFADYQSSGQQHTASWTLNGNTVDSLTYAYDSLGNLVSQYRVAGSQSNTETYLYDQLQRLTNASRTGGSVSYGYSASGNLTSKSDFGSYGYAGANSHNGNCGPHATYAAGGFTYACDANGNVYGGSTLSIAYDADNHPRTATRNGATDTWAYDANGQRDYESTTRGIRYFGPGGYEQVGTQGIHELGPIVVTRTNGANTVTTTLRDRLGSTIDTIDAGVANSANTRTYDAFGAVREGNMANRAGGTLNLNDTIHGFTKHEHADDVQLIHMGGRIYDYQLGRFLSVDPIIGNPLSSQSLNPYSYVGNNPLSGTDPTGYYAHCNGNKLCQLVDDIDFLGGIPGKLRSSLSYPGQRPPSAFWGNGNDSSSDTSGNKKSEKNLPSVTVGAIESLKIAIDLGKGVMVAQNGIDPSVCEEVGAELCAAHSGAEGKAPINEIQKKIAAGEEVADKIATTVVKEAANPLNYIAPEARILEGANDLRRASKLTADIIKGTNREMFQQARAQIAGLSGTAMEKVAEFERLAGQITAHSRGAWSMQPRIPGSDGSFIYIGEGAPYIMVISHDGRVFSGRDFTNSTIRQGDVWTPIYSAMQEIK